METAVGPLQTQCWNPPSAGGSWVFPSPPWPSGQHRAGGEGSSTRGPVGDCGNVPPPAIGLCQQRGEESLFGFERSICSAERQMNCGWRAHVNTVLFMGGVCWSISQRVSSHILHHGEEAVTPYRAEALKPEATYGVGTVRTGHREWKEHPQRAPKPCAHRLPRTNVLAINLWLGAEQENRQVHHGSAMRKPTRAGPGLIVCKSPRTLAIKKPLLFLSGFAVCSPSLDSCPDVLNFSSTPKKNPG